jgi:hypothetical protein
MNAPFLVPTNTRTLLILLFAQMVRRTSGGNQDKNLTPSRLRQGFVGQGRKGAKTDSRQKEAKVRPQPSGFGLLAICHLSSVMRFAFVSFAYFCLKSVRGLRDLL